MEKIISEQKEAMDTLVEENRVLREQIAMLTAQVSRLERAVGEAVRTRYAPSPMS